MGVTRVSALKFRSRADRADRTMTCGFTVNFRFAGGAGCGTAVGPILRAFVLILLRVRRAACRTNWAVASAQSRWICGRTARRAGPGAGAGLAKRQHWPI